MLALVAGMCPQWLSDSYDAIIAVTEGSVKSMAMLAVVGEPERSAFTVVPKKQPMKPE